MTQPTNASQSLLECGFTTQEVSNILEHGVTPDVAERRFSVACWHAQNDGWTITSSAEGWRFTAPSTPAAPFVIDTTGEPHPGDTIHVTTVRPFLPTGEPALLTLRTLHRPTAEEIRAQMARYFPQTSNWVVTAHTTETEPDATPAEPQTSETPEAELQALVDVLAAQNSHLRTQAEILANALNLAVTHGTFSDIIHEHLNEILTRYGTR